MTGQKLTPFRVYDDSRSFVPSEYFDERHPRIEYRPVAFDLERVGMALFASTYRNPITLLFPKERAYPKVVSDIAVTVELVHAVFSADENDEPLAAAYETPDWYLRGMACFASQSVSRAVPAHVSLMPSDAAELQVLCDKSLILTGS